MAGGNRYSTTVAWVKVALPLVALALLSTLFLLSRTPDPDAALPFADVDVEQLVREQRLSRPRFAGTLDDGREVTVVAGAATATAENPGKIVMTAIEGRVTLSADAQMTLTAETGDLDLSDQIVSLAGSVDAVTTDGYRLATENLIVAMDTMHLMAPGAIRLVGPGLTLDAGAMDLSGAEGAAFVSFTGGVRLLYDAQN